MDVYSSSQENTVIPGKSKSTALFGPNVSTGGVHPLVKKTMQPIMKRAKIESLAARSKAMAVPPKRRANG